MLMPSVDAMSLLRLPSRLLIRNTRRHIVGRLSISAHRRLRVRFVLAGRYRLRAGWQARAISYIYKYGRKDTKVVVIKNKIIEKIEK